MAMSSVKRSCICALCTALCYVLPLAFHAVGLGSAFSPMHIPVLLCGLVCGPVYGGFCGLAGPVISSVLSGMPTVTQLFSMVPELMVYGIVCGALMGRVHTRSAYADLYCAMVPAMILGRVVGGVAKALFYLASSAGTFTLALWASSYFLETLPGTILQLVAVPTLILTLQKARLIPATGTEGGGAV
jgi:uncharacterized membrane protein